MAPQLRVTHPQWPLSPRCRQRRPAPGDPRTPRGTRGGGSIAIPLLLRLQDPPSPQRGVSAQRDPSPGAATMVRFVTSSLELRARQDTARAKRQRQARGGRDCQQPPLAAPRPPQLLRGQGWLAAEPPQRGAAGAAEPGAAAEKRAGDAGCAVLGAE